jgi:hypothetical protein
MESLWWPSMSTFPRKSLHEAWLMWKCTTTNLHFRPFVWHNNAKKKKWMHNNVCFVFFGPCVMLISVLLRSILFAYLTRWKAQRCYDPVLNWWSSRAYLHHCFPLIDTVCVHCEGIRMRETFSCLSNSTVCLLCVLWSLFVCPVLLIHRWVLLLLLSYMCSCTILLYYIHPRVDLLFEDFLMMVAELKEGERMSMYC